MPAAAKRGRKRIDTFANIVGPSNVRAAIPADATGDALPACVVAPATEAELAQCLAAAQRVGLHVLPRGGGTKSTWGDPPPAGGVVLSTRRLDQVIEHAAGDMTATVEAGCTVTAFQETLAKQGQRVALDPLWPDQATIGGVLATNDSGSLRHAFGSLRDLVLGVTVALPDGTLARSGGKVVKNVAGYDLPKLMTGAMGTLGVITRATFRLHPLPRATRTFAFAAPTPQDANRFTLAVQDSTLPVTGLQVVAEAGEARVALRVEGSNACVAASVNPIFRIAAACGLTESAHPEPWAERERLWGPPGVVAKITFLPSRLAELCGEVKNVRGTLVAQGIGVGLLAVSEVDEAAMDTLAQKVSGLGGATTVLRGPSQWKRRLNTPANALPLMRRIKQQFDPAGILNSG